MPVRRLRALPDDDDAAHLDRRPVAQAGELPGGAGPAGRERRAQEGDRVGPLGEAGGGVVPRHLLGRGRLRERGRRLGREPPGEEVALAPPAASPSAVQSAARRPGASDRSAPASARRASQARDSRARRARSSTEAKGASRRAASTASPTARGSPRMRERPSRSAGRSPGAAGTALPRPFQRALPVAVRGVDARAPPPRGAWRPPPACAARRSPWAGCRAAPRRRRPGGSASARPTRRPAARRRRRATRGSRSRRSRGAAAGWRRRPSRGMPRSAMPAVSRPRISSMPLVGALVGHGPAQLVGLAGGVAGGHHREPHGLLLEERDAQRALQHRPQRLVGVADLLQAVAAAQEGVDHAALDGPGADDGHRDDEVVEAARPQPGEQRHLRPRLDLEDADGVGPARSSRRPPAPRRGWRRARPGRGSAVAPDGRRPVAREQRERTGRAR